MSKKHEEHEEMEFDMDMVKHIENMDRAEQAKLVKSIEKLALPLFIGLPADMFKRSTGDLVMAKAVVLLYQQMLDEGKGNNHMVGNLLVQDAVVGRISIDLDIRIEPAEDNPKFNEAVPENETRH